MRGVICKRSYFAVDQSPLRYRQSSKSIQNSNFEPEQCFFKTKSLDCSTSFIQFPTSFIQLLTNRKQLFTQMSGNNLFPLIYSTFALKNTARAQSLNFESIYSIAYTSEDLGAGKIPYKMLPTSRPVISFT